MIELLRALLYFHLRKMDYLMKNSMRQKYTSPTCSGHLALAGKVSRCYHPEKVEHTMKSWHKILIPHFPKKTNLCYQMRDGFQVVVQGEEVRFEARCWLKIPVTILVQLFPENQDVPALAIMFGIWNLLSASDPLIWILSSFVINTVYCGLQ